ncbi:MAG: hypothetical protein AB1641_22860 [Thermodesulfobacteriota bacterium]
METKSFVTEENESVVTIKFTIDANEHTVYFKSKQIRLQDSAEALLNFSILPNLYAGSNLRLNRPISRRLCNSTKKIIDIFCKWNPKYNYVEIIDAVPGRTEDQVERRVGVFFSTGLDSIYTLLKNLHEITDMIFIHGYDLRISEIDLRKKTSDIIEQIGREFNKNVIHVETNLKDVLGQYIPWAKLLHGAALTTIGHMMSRHFRKIFISANHTYANLQPNGAHPILDPLWSTESLEFEHFGCEADRIEKAAYIAQFEIALNSLRVCWKKTGGAYNCGECNKCLITMINLYLAGALDRCSTFDKKISYWKMKMELNFMPEGWRAYVRQNIDHLEKTNSDKKMLKALRKIYNRTIWGCYFIAAIKKAGMLYEKYKKR